MYTGTVELRAVAFVLALCVGLGPVTRVMCEFDCDTPKSQEPRQACHTASESTDGASVRDAGHACGHRHDSVPALMTVSIARDVGVRCTAELPSASLAALAATPQLSQLPSMHGPPGSTARSTAFSTILRI